MLHRSSLPYQHYLKVFSITTISRQESNRRIMRERTSILLTINEREVLELGNQDQSTIPTNCDRSPSTKNEARTRCFCIWQPLLTCPSLTWPPRTYSTRQNIKTVETLTKDGRVNCQTVSVRVTQKFEKTVHLRGTETSPIHRHLVAFSLSVSSRCVECAQYRAFFWTGKVYPFYRQRGSFDFFRQSGCWICVEIGTEWTKRWARAMGRSLGVGAIVQLLRPSGNTTKREISFPNFNLSRKLSCYRCASTISPGWIAAVHSVPMTLMRFWWLFSWKLLLLVHSLPGLNGSWISSNHPWGTSKRQSLKPFEQVIGTQSTSARQPKGTLQR